ncbi:MAG: SagB/ThcOx family dehydrogenase [Planctomycetota bacterium]
MSAATEYHALTKYSRENLHAHPGLDWSKAPGQFKEVVGSHRVELRSFGKKPNADDLRSVLARFLYFANGVTGHLVHPGGEQLLRAAPSAGALYPTEIYVAVGEETEIEPGLYAYDARDEVLTRLWEEDPRGILGRACGAEELFRRSRACLVATGVFWRSAWRYQERGYRRVLLDTGHVLANLASIAPFDELNALPHLGFVDNEINGAFFFEEDREGTLACIPLLPLIETHVPPPLWRSAAGTGIDAATPGVIQDADDLTGSATAALHRASGCAVPDPVDPPCGLVAADSGALRIGVEADDVKVEVPRAIARRRSARAYPGLPIPFDDLKRALAFTFPLFVPHETWDAGLLRAHLIVHRIDGLDAGIYELQGDGEALLPIKFGDFGPRCAEACLGQEIASTAAGVLAFTASARDALELYGDRAYRYLHIEAGSLGQRFQLAATDLGHQACGIAGFLDDETTALLDLPSEDWVIYLVTVGAASP